MIGRRDLLAWAIGLLSVRMDGPHGLAAARIVEIDQQVRTRFHYRQPATHPLWAFEDQVIADQPWEGNCVNLAMTTLGLIRRAGSPPGTLQALLVRDAQYGGQHAVGVATDDLGRKWVVGDTFRPAYPLSVMRHKLIHEFPYA